MKTLSFEQVLNWVGVIVGVTLISLVIFNIAVYGISSSASFEF
jgi:hypothetical protein